MMQGYQKFGRVDPGSHPHSDFGSQNYLNEIYNFLRGYMGDDLQNFG